MTETTNNNARSGIIKPALVTALIHSLRQLRRFEAMQFVERTKEAELLSRDGLHQNDQGYRCMAEHIARAVVLSAFAFNRPSATSP